MYDPDEARDRWIEDNTDWERIMAHKPEGAVGYSMTAAELRKPCERPGCTCRWTAKAEEARA